MKDGEGTEDFTFTREQGPRPHGANPERHHQVPIIIPTALCKDVGHVHRLPAINSGAAGGTFRTDLRAAYVIAKSGKTWCCGAIETGHLFIREPDRAEQLFALRFDEPGDSRQNVWQR